MHIIKAQEYQIIYDDAHAAHRLQTTISGLQDTRIDPLLDRILNEFSSEDFTYQFDTIELDLGSISPSNYENELVLRIEEALTAYLSATIYDRGKLRDGISIHTDFNLLLQLEHFLDKGHYRWNSHPNSDTSRLLAELVRTKSAELRDMLKRVGRSTQTRKRMIFQFTDSELNEIVKLVARQDGEYMVEYKDNVLDYHKKKKVVNTSFSSLKSVVWEIVLAYLFADNRSYYDKRSFLKHLIQKMASRYNLDFGDLLETLNEVAYSNPQLARRKAEFGKLIYDLRSTTVPNKVSERVHEKHEDETIWLNEFEYYMEHGYFRTEYSGGSMTRFNAQFISRLHASDDRLKKQLDLWLADPVKNKRLVEIVDSRSLNKIVDRSKIPAIELLREFLKMLEQNKAGYTDNSRRIIEQFTAAKGELIMKLPVRRNYSEKKLIHRLLRNMLVISSQNEDAIIQFLLEAKPELRERYQIIISDFLMTFYQNMGLVVLDNIGREIRDYTSRSPMRFWRSWLHEKMPDWVRATRLAPEKVLDYVSENFKRSQTPKAVRFLISQGLDPGNFEDKIYREIDKDWKEKRENEIFYLIEHGKIPWWIDPTAFWNNFSEEYGLLWASANNRELLVKHLRKRSSRISYVRYLEESQFDALLEEIGGTRARHRVLFLKSIRQFVYRYLVPIGKVSHSKYLALKEAMLKHFLSAQSDSWLSLVKFLKAWEGNVVIESRQSLSTAFERVLRATIAVLTDTEAKRQLADWLTQLPKYPPTPETDAGTDRSLIEMLTPLVSNPGQLKDKTGIMGELQKMILVRPVSFDRFLSNEFTRKSLIKELSREDVSSLIELKLASRQKESFQLALHHLDRYKRFLSHREFSEIVSLFGENILLQLGTDGTHSWTVKEWGKLLYHTVNYIIGKSKHQNILFRIKDKFSLEQGKYQNRNLRFIAQLNELVDETSEKVLAETRKLFQEMVGESKVVDDHKDEGKIDIDKITLLMDRRQLSLHRNAMAYLENFKSYISAREMREIRELTAKILDSQVSRSSLRNWKIIDWGTLIFHSVNEVLGVEKNLKLLYKINRIKGAGSSDYESKMDSVEAVIKSLADNASEKKLKTIKDEFDSSVEQAQTRRRLEESKLLKEEVRQIEKKVLPSQTEFYRLVISHLNSYRQHITTEDHNAISRLISRYILLKLEDNDLGSWRMKDWGHLLFHSINEVLGAEKNEEIRSRIHRQLNIETEIEINESQLLVDELSALANELPLLDIERENEIATEKPYRKLGETMEREFLDPIFINNAGLIILAPYLPILFERCGLMEASKFHDERSKYMAVQLLSYAATGDVVREEHDLVINKVLCGLDLMAPLDRVQELTDSEKEMVDGLLTAVTQQWTPLKETSINSLRETFLQRQGKLVEEENFYLKVEQRSYDMLLDRIPWNISKIKLSWMEKILEVEWKT